MTRFLIVTPDAALVVQKGESWQVQAHLGGMGAEAAAADGQRLYVGTESNGLFRSTDGGQKWQATPFPAERASALATQGGVLYAGSGPSTFWRSEDGGDSWQEMKAMLDLPSAGEWSFPPQPDTHHVRWIEPDPNERGKLYVAIEAGALLRTTDGGETWQDRVRSGPFDTHTAATQRSALGRVYSAAGDGYYESSDGGESWRRMMDGLGHRYLVGVAVDAGDAQTVVVSAASGPGLSYHPRRAEAYVYRKSGGGPFESAMEGLPAAQGTVASRLAADPEAEGVFYAANNHGLFRSTDGGRSWAPLPVRWPAGMFRQRVNGLVVF